MKLWRSKEKSQRPSDNVLSPRFFFIIVAPLLLFASCGEISTPQSDPLIVQTPPPAKQEFRWTNGKLPKSFDPAFASAPPESDVVRALYEGLTDIDAKTLQEIPGVAESWSVSEDHRTWTFNIRRDARWTDGKPVTAADFVRSWTRAVKIGRAVPQRDLFSNIQGMREIAAASPALSPTPDTLNNIASPAFPAATPPPPPPPQIRSDRPDAEGPIDPAEAVKPDGKPAPVEPTWGVIAESEHILKITLVEPDRDFAKLVASPVFRPLSNNVGNKDVALDPNLVSNGPFRISVVGPEGVTLSRSDNYWDKGSVELERVRFVPKEGAEKALEAYRKGDVDAVTNADFEPLALKLLSPYDDFRQTTHSALNLYEINFRKAPFSDRRVRQALAMAIEREVLTEGELQSSSRPALSFLPFARKGIEKLTQDRELAREMLDEAGFPDGSNFPVIRLVVNRNDVQQRIARLVAKMWKRTLNVDTEIVIRSLAEVEETRASGDYDIIRRGLVLPSNDEAMSMLAIFGPGETGQARAAGQAGQDGKADGTADDGKNEIPSATNSEPGRTNKSETAREPAAAADAILSESIAISELRAIPLYFPISYSLVKPYVSGFEINGLDAPSLKDVSIDNGWQPQ